MFEHDWAKDRDREKLTHRKWTLVHKDLICVLYLTLMALCLLKYAQQAGNIWKAHNDVEMHVHHCLDWRCLLCLSVRATQKPVSRSQWNPDRPLKLLCGRSLQSKNQSANHCTLLLTAIVTRQSLSNDSALNIRLTMPKTVFFRQNERRLWIPHRAAGQWSHLQTHYLMLEVRLGVQVWQRPWRESKWSQQRLVSEPESAPYFTVFAQMKPWSHRAKIELLYAL